VRPTTVFLIMAMLSAAAIPARAGQVRVDVSNIHFTPATVTIHHGDHVVWVWVSGLHSATSGSSRTEGGIFNSAPVSADAGVLGAHQAALPLIRQPAAPKWSWPAPPRGRVTPPAEPSASRPGAAVKRPTNASGDPAAAAARSQSARPAGSTASSNS